jgi:hypothetical protein
MRRLCSGLVEDHKRSTATHKKNLAVLCGNAQKNLAVNAQKNLAVEL